MVADLRGMQENQRVSELWIDKLEFICFDFIAFIAPKLWILTT